MNKRINLVVLFVVLFNSTTLFAQHKPFQFGFKAGLNMGWYSSIDENYKNNGVKIGGSWGFAADFFIMENYSFTTGFDVLYHNGSMTYPDSHYFDDHSQPRSGKMERDFHTKYLRLPLIFTMKTNKIKKVRYYGQIGLGISFLLTARADDTFTADIDGETDSSKDNIYDEMTFARMSVLIGAGVEVPIHKSTYARIGLLFDNAFINVLKGYNKLDPAMQNNGRNSLIELSASLLF